LVILDEDVDGAVTQVEFLRNKTKIFYRALKDVDQDQGLGPDEISVTPQAFDEADLNGDGKLSGAEFVQARFNQFESINADGDQKITNEEFQALARLYRL
jgi:EF-hand domain pair